MSDRSKSVVWVLTGAAVPLAVSAALLPLRHRMAGNHFGRLAILNPEYELLDAAEGVVKH